MPENENTNEPEATEPEATEPEATTANETPAAAPAEPEAPAAQRRPLPSWATSRTALAAAAAVGVFLVGGLSGFAIGHATGDDGRGDRFAPAGFRNGPNGFEGGPGGQNGGQNGGPGFRGPNGQLPPSTEGDSQGGSGTETPDDSGTAS